MKNLAQLLSKKNLSNRPALDQQSIFFVFGVVIKDEYGKRGVENIVPLRYAEKNIIVRTQGALWAGELQLQKNHLINRINQQIGSEEVRDIVANNQ